MKKAFTPSAKTPVRKPNSLTGFTLIELLVVIIVISILGTLAFIQYRKTVEKGRAAEARIILGHIRTLQEAFRVKQGGYTDQRDALPLLAGDAPDVCSEDIRTHYFRYILRDDGTARAERCCGAEGKQPGFPCDEEGGTYSITLNYATGDFGGTAGY